MSGARIKVNLKKRGRPATGNDPLISLRMPQATIDAIEALAARNAESRAQTIRRLIGLALKAKLK